MWTIFIRLPFVPTAPRARASHRPPPHRAVNVSALMPRRLIEACAALPAVSSAASFRSRKCAMSAASASGVTVRHTRPSTSCVISSGRPPRPRHDGRHPGLLGLDDRVRQRLRPDGGTHMEIRHGEQARHVVDVPKKANALVQPRRLHLADETDGKRVRPGERAGNHEADIVARPAEREGCVDQNVHAFVRCDLSRRRSPCARGRARARVAPPPDAWQGESR